MKEVIDFHAELLEVTEMIPIYCVDDIGVHLPGAMNQMVVNSGQLLESQCKFICVCLMRRCFPKFVPKRNANVSHWGQR
jgi:hypothetical protein